MDLGYVQVVVTRRVRVLKLDGWIKPHKDRDPSCVTQPPVFKQP